MISRPLSIPVENKKTTHYIKQYYGGKYGEIAYLPL